MVEGAAANGGERTHPPHCLCREADDEMRRGRELKAVVPGITMIANVTRDPAQGRPATELIVTPWDGEE